MPASRGVVTGISLLGLLGTTLASGDARADEDRAACREAFEQGQVLRDDGKLAAARQKLLKCIRVCPVAFQKPCEGWISEIESSQPTIVLRAIDGHGQDLMSVSVKIDGVPLAVKLDGKSVPIDPGPHAVTFEATGRPKIVKNVVIGQGEKNRIVVATLAYPVAPTRAAPPEPAPPYAAIAVGGLGLVLLGGFAYFGLKGNAQHDELVNGCSKTGTCTQGDKDAVLLKWHVADALLGAGVVALGVGTYLFLGREGKGSSRASVSIRPAREGASADIRIFF